MKYEKIISLVPEGEHFDATAVNEGVWITQTHLDAIENNITLIAGENETLHTQINDAVIAASQSIAELETATQAITDKDAEIVRLNALIVELNKKPAGDFLQTTKDADDLGGETVVESEITKEANRLRAMMGKKPV